MHDVITVLVQGDIDVNQATFLGQSVQRAVNVRSS